jgi:hypothetical protein
MGTQGTPSGEISGQSFHSVERRSHIRYRLDVPAIFSWESSQRSRLQGEGITRDIGLEGAFILTATCPPVQATIQLVVLLPPLTGARATIRIKGEARVLRVEPRREEGVIGGFAVLTDGFNLYPSAADGTKSEFKTVKELLELRRSDA